MENPHGLILAADVRHETSSSVPELYGDVNALIDVDLEREGLGEYKSQVQALNNSHVREYLSPNSSGGRNSLVFNNGLGVNLNHDGTSHVVVARSPSSHLHSPTSLPTVTSPIMNQNQIVPN